MKLLKTASGNTIIKMSKFEWEKIGKIAGWLYHRCCNCHKIIGEPEFKPNKPKDEIVPSDGLCPECNRKLYGEWLTEEQMKQYEQEFAEKQQSGHI